MFGAHITTEEREQILSALLCKSNILRKTHEVGYSPFLLNALIKEMEAINKLTKKIKGEK